MDPIESIRTAIDSLRKANQISASISVLMHAAGEVDSEVGYRAVADQLDAFADQKARSWFTKTVTHSTIDELRTMAETFRAMADEKRGE